MVLDTSKLSVGSWRTTLVGCAFAGMTFLQSWLANSKTINWHDPVLLIGLGMAVLGFVAKDSNKTGGTSLVANAIPDARLHAEAVVAKVETPAEASPVPVPPKP